MDTNDKGLRKFQIALAGMGVIFLEYVIAGWRGWSPMLFDSACVATVTLALGFASTNVAEKVFTRRKKAVPAKPVP